MADKMRDKRLDELFDAVLSLKTADECYSFFTDLCTVAELRDMSQRLQVARLLRGKTVYSEIVKKTGASTATISRVNRALEYGNDGYKLVFDRETGK